MAPPPPPPHSPTGDDCLSFLASATSKELQVIKILLQLRHTMDMNANAPGPKWIGKRKRSCLSAASPPSPPLNTVENKPPQVKSVESEVATATAAAAARDTASPVSPFAFPRGESLEKPRHGSKKRSKKRLEEEYIEAAKEGDKLRKELEIVNKSYNQLKAKNSQLKAIEQQLLNCCPSNHKERIGNHHLQPLMVAAHPRAENRVMSGNGIPDLNVGVWEEHQTLDLMESDRRVRCAEARCRRKGLLLKMRAGSRSR